jgi:hypothetical protein
VATLSAVRRNEMSIREEMRSLGQDIIRSYEDRIGGIAQINSDVRTMKSDANAMLKRFDHDHTAMSRQMRAELARGRADLTKAEARRKSEVNSWIKEVATAHQAMARKLRGDLAKACADLRRDVGALRKRFDAELKEVRADLAGAHQEWHRMTVTMQATRQAPAGKVAPLQAEGKAVADVIPEAAALRERVLEYLAKHPHGAKMAELEQQFRLSRIEMARVIRSLIDDNRVEKRDLIYFAT